MAKIKDEIIATFEKESPGELNALYDKRLTELADASTALISVIADSIEHSKKENIDAIRADIIELIKFSQKLGASRFAIDMLEVEDDGR